MPTLLKGFGKDSGLSATLIGFILIVPSVTGAIAIVLNGNHSDKIGERKWHTIIPMLFVACAYLLITLPIGGLRYKIAILALYGIGSTAWYGPYWTLPASFIAPEILAVSMAVINTSSSLGGYIGNQLAGIVSAQFGSTGVFIFMACCVFASVLLVLTLDTKKIAKKTVSKA